MLSSQKGIKKIGKHKIDDLKKNQNLIKYDVIIEFYQNLNKKEKEQVEGKQEKEAQGSRTLDESSTRGGEVDRPEVRRRPRQQRDGVDPEVDPREAGEGAERQRDDLNSQGQLQF